MNEQWFEVVAANTPLTQGDLLRDCRVLDWRTAESAILRDWSEERLVDAIVMTQACDLENRKVANVVLCPCYSLSVYRSQWEHRMRQRNQTFSEKSWRRTLEDVAAGQVWNQLLLERFESLDYGVEIQIVEFQMVFTVPRDYLEPLYAQRAKSRLRLRPPYREHLSQAFARFFMRVGLPQAVTLPGQS